MNDTNLKIVIPRQPYTHMHVTNKHPPKNVHDILYISRYHLLFVFESKLYYLLYKRLGNEDSV